MYAIRSYYGLHEAGSACSVLLHREGQGPGPCLDRLHRLEGEVDPLRPQRGWIARTVRAMETVITSYSIHYTKLYEKTSLQTTLASALPRETTTREVTCTTPPSTQPWARIST